MNIIKRLSAVTSLAVCIGVLAPTTIVLAKTSSTNDSQISKSEDPELHRHSVGFALSKATGQTGNKDIHLIFGNSLLKQGDSGFPVYEIQEVLHQLGYYNGKVSGTFDTPTTEATKAFQSDYRIEEDGIVGADTKTALYEIYRHTDEAKVFQIRASEIKQAEKKAAAEARKKQAEARKAAAEKAAAEAAHKRAEVAKKAAAEAAQKKEQSRSSRIIQKTSYRPQRQTPSSGSSLTVVATSYALGGRTATGVDLGNNPNARVVAVDPHLIPLGSRVLIPGYGVFTAADTGGNIKGKRIDIHFPSKSQSLQFGRRAITIKILH